MSPNTAPTFIIADGKVYDSRSGTTEMITLHDGSLLLSGDTGLAGGAQSMLRFTADGILDTAFGSGGLVSTRLSLPWLGGSSTSVAELADGTLIQAGMFFFNTGTTSGGAGTLLASNPDGSENLVFGTGGLVVAGETISAVLTQDDGKLLAVGTYRPGEYRDFTLLRFNADGSFDQTFAGGGYDFTAVTTGGAAGWASSEFAYDVALQSDGKILVAGNVAMLDLGGFNHYIKWGVFRTNSDGSLDTSFGDGGLATVDYAHSILDHAEALAVQGDGKILLAGRTAQAGFALVRFNADGSLDTSFGNAGKVFTDGLAEGFGGVNDLVVQGDGKILAVGTGGLARYNADGSLDSSFAGDGLINSEDGFVASDHAFSVQLLADERFLVAGYSDMGETFLLRYNADGSPDTSFGGVIDSTLVGHLTGFFENDRALLAPDARIFDAEMAAAGNYAGASLILARQGGANPDDWFAGSGSLGTLSEGGSLTIDGVVIGTVVTNGGGSLSLSFDSLATQARVDAVLRQIVYGNSSDEPPEQVTIDWTFSDGSLSTTEGREITIFGFNDAPILVMPLADAQAAAYMPFTLTLPAGSFVDPEPSDVLSYSAVRENGYPLPDWLSFDPVTATFSGTPGNDNLRPLNIAVIATDSSGAQSYDVFTLTVAGQHHVLGTDGQDVLYGTAWGDTLDGGLMGDTLAGRAGNDTYIVDDLADQVIEAADAGIDRVKSSVCYSLTDNVENLVLTGAGRSSGAGNSLDNQITGNSANNQLCGLEGNDILAGRGGNDTLDGGLGADTMVGGRGNDDYLLDDALDTLIEVGGEGFDRVFACIGATLADNVEKLILTGSAAINGSGNDLANGLVGNAAANWLNGMAGDDTLIGGPGDDTLTGGAGSDSMIGGLGMDVFVFDNLDAHDTISGFHSVEDTFILDHGVLNGLTPGYLAGAAFVRGPGASAALDAADRIIYDTITGHLYYDVDGLGNMPAIQLATLTGAPTVRAGDFLVV